MINLKHTLVAFASVIVVASCSQPSKDEATVDFATYELEQFYQNEKIHGGYFSSDDQKLIYTSKKTGIYNVFAAATDGSSEDQLTSSTEESYFAVSYFPGDSRIL
ncbi:MAG: hypothetical protein RJQ09_16065 [Cyclobacteriaceae bacterium]